MKLNINGTDFELAPPMQEQLMALVWGLLLEKYEGIGSTAQLGIKLIVRNKILQPLEQKLTELYGKEIGRQARPERGGDPVIHAGVLLMPQFREVLNRTTLNLTIDEGADTISAVSISTESARQGGGSLDTDWRDGERQNDGAQIS